MRIPVLTVLLLVGATAAPLAADDARADEGD